MKSALVIMAVLSIGCSSMTERVVHEAQRGLVWEADYVPKEGGDSQRLAALHKHLVVTLGIDIEFLPADDPTLRGAFGISYGDGEQAYIRLRQDLSVNGTIEVLCHEAAHLFQPPYLTRSEGDVFAEIVSAHVAAKLGVPKAAATSGLWLRQHKAALRTGLALQKEIEYVAKKLTP